MTAHCVAVGGPDGPAIDWPARIARERRLAEHEPAHQPRIERGVPALGLARFGDARARLGSVRDFGPEVEIGLAAFGREGSIREVGDAGTTAGIVGAEVRITRAPGVVEWWRSLAIGLEQGVTIETRPPGEGALTLEMTTGVGVHPELASPDEVVLRSATGEPLARYAHLLVLDADGDRVPARLAVAATRIRIQIDDSLARYPLVVDPLLYGVEEAVLVDSTGTPDDQFGTAVALSSDASRALVGQVPVVSFDGSSATVFLRTGTSWTVEGRLVASGREIDDAFGGSLVLSSDGSRALVGADRDDVGPRLDTGSGRVFLRMGTTWTEEATLVSADGRADDYLGCSVAMSGDGSRALLGALGDDTVGGASAGSARVFSRTGTVWAEEATLLASGAAAGDFFGESVALSADGTRAIVGALYASGGGALAGSAYVFLRTGTSWMEEATLVPFAAAPGDTFGTSVALSADGSRALVGANRDDTSAGMDAGSAHVFLRVGTVWSEETTLVAVAGAPSDYFGGSVALSADGASALVGVSSDDTVSGANAGSARIFVRTGTVWTEASAFVASDGAPGDGFGSSVELSADGGRALVGAPADDTPRGPNAGTARVFLIRPGAVTGAPCVVGAECLTSFCGDGVCCNSACGDGTPSDCVACAAALTGLASGTCAQLSAAIAPTVVCRLAAGACDRPEVCTALSTSCPIDTFVLAGTTCRTSAAACDAAETCTGISAPCPPDVPAVGGTTCRAAAASCDRPEVCDGVSFSCGSDELVAAGSVCRAPAGPCDAAEACTGTGSVCPADALAAFGTACGLAAGGPCDAADTCSGTSTGCPDAFAPAGTVCGPPATDVCDSPDHCTGASGECLARYLSGVECRPASGACDSPEVCLGDSSSCPPDVVYNAGLLCRVSTDPSCDLEEACDGSSTACPSDVSGCGPRVDAAPGVDAGPTADSGGPAIDASAASDAASPVAIATGCGCAIAAPRAVSAAPLVCALLLAAALTRLSRTAAPRRRQAASGQARAARPR